MAWASELADEWIDLPQAQRRLRIAFQAAAHEAVFRRARFQRQGASVIGGRHAILFGQCKHAQDAAHGHFSLALVQSLTQRADVRSGGGGTVQEPLRAGRSSPGTVFVFDPMAAALLAQVLPQQLAGERIDQADLRRVSLHLNAAPDPAGRCAIVGRFHCDAAIQVHRALGVLVVAEQPYPPGGSASTGIRRLVIKGMPGSFRICPCMALPPGSCSISPR